MDHLAALTFRCAAGGAVPFLTLQSKGKCEEWLPNWSASCWDVWCRGNWRWSADLTCWAAHQCQGSGDLKFWSGTGSEHLTHWVCGTSTGPGSGREKPWKKASPNWPHSSERGPLEGGVHLLGLPGLLVLLSLNHTESLVLIILGQPFQFEGSLCSSWALALVISCNSLRVRLKPSTSSVCILMSLSEWKEMMGTDTCKGGGKWCSSSELSHSVFLRTG